MFTWIRVTSDVDDSRKPRVREQCCYLACPIAAVALVVFPCCGSGPNSSPKLVVVTASLLALVPAATAAVAVVGPLVAVLVVLVVLELVSARHCTCITRTSFEFSVQGW